MQTGPTKILLIDHDPETTRRLQAALAEVGAARFDLASAKTPARGLALLKKERFDVILLGLPDGPIPQAFDALRKLASHIPIILLASSEEQAETMSDRVPDYLIKSQISGSLLAYAMRYAAERKMAKKNLAESELRFRGLFKNASLAIFQTSSDGTILEANPAFLRQFGYETLEDLQATLKNASGVFANPGRRTEIIEAVRQNPSQNSFESPYRRKDGSTFLGLLKVNLVTDGDGEPLYIEGFIEDITERRRAEAEMSRRTDELNALNALGRQISRSLSLQEVIDDVARETFHAIQPDLAFLFLKEEGRLVLRSIAPADGLALFEGVSEHRVGECMCGLAAQQGIPLYSKDIFTDLRCTWVECKKAGLRSFAALPLRDSNEVIGVVGLAARQERDFEKEANFLETLVSQVSIGIRNARLYEAVQKELGERKQSENALRESEARYRLLFELSPNAISVYRDGKIVFSNPAAVKLLGASKAEQLIGKTVMDFVHPDYRAMVAERSRQQLSEGKIVPLAEEKFLRLDGSAVDVDVIAAPLHTRDETSVMVIFRDITERKQSENALRQSENKLRTLFAAMTDVILVLDQDGRYLEIAPTSPSLLYKPSDELVGKTLLETFPQPLAETFLGRLRAALAEKRMQHFEYDLEIAGQTITFGATISPMTEDTVVWVARDISEPRRAARALQESRQMLRNVLDTIPTRVFWKDRGLAFLGCNQPFAHDAGLASPEEIIGKNDFQMSWAEQAESYRADDQAVMDTGMPKLDYEEAQNTPDGAVRWLRTSKIPLVDVEGRVIGILGTYEDITARKLAEQEIARRLAEMEAVNRISTALRGSQTLEEMLPRLLDETLKMVGTDAGEILLYDPVAEKLRMSVSRGWFTQTRKTDFEADEGITGYVFQTGEPYLSPEYALDPLIEQVDQPDIPHGWGGICVPIRAEQETIGVLFISVRLPRQLNREDAHLLTTISEIAGNAIRRVALHEQTLRQLQHLDALRSIDTAISSMFDLRLTLGILLEHITNQLVVDAADILLFNPLTHTLQYAAGRGFRTTGIEHTNLHLGEGYPGRAALERTRTHIADLTIQGKQFLRQPLLSSEVFVAYYCVPLVTKGQVKGVLEVFHRAPLKPDTEWLDFLETLAGQTAIAIDSASLFESLQHSNLELATAYDATIEGWSRALDLRDRETEGHTQRVTEMAIQLAKALNMSDEELVHLRRGTLLHDIGKMGVPDEILHKAGPLTDEELKIMHQHPQLAYEMLSPIAYLRQAIDVPHYHHERWDGNGYPGGLKGEQIPYAARIFSIVDVYDALISDRPYRKAWTREAALDHIRKRAGKHFDPNLVAIFLKLQESVA